MRDSLLFNQLRYWGAMPRMQQIGVFFLCLMILLRTITPTFYNLDSAEFAIGAEQLGLVHAPGYGLYLVLAHAFSALPWGDVGYRVNLFSALCLALTAPVLYTTLVWLTCHRLASLCATLVFMWSYYVWLTGLVAEVYAPQILTLTLVLWALAVLYRRPVYSPRRAIGTGALFGLAVAMHPSSILFAPGMVIAFRGLRIPWRTCLLAAAVGTGIFLVSLLYFPLRYAVHPALNLAGTYNTQGEFEAVNLQTLSGIWWMISGQQFGNVFFADGLMPRWTEVIPMFWANYLGVGLLLGSAGAYHLARTERKLFWGWLTMFVPYTYFYATYGVSDLETMFGPTYLLWAIVLSYGVRWLLDSLPQARLRLMLALGLALVVLIINFPLVDLSEDRSVRVRAEQLIDTLPPNAAVFGHWWEIVPLQYLQMVEGHRTDVTLRNLFLFAPGDFDVYVEWHLRTSSDPLVLLGNSLPILPPTVHASMMPLTIRVLRTGQVTADPVIAGFVFTRAEEMLN